MSGEQFNSFTEWWSTTIDMQFDKHPLYKFLLSVKPLFASAWYCSTANMPQDIDGSIGDIRIHGLTLSQVTQLINYVLAKEGKFPWEH